MSYTVYSNIACPLQHSYINIRKFSIAFLSMMHSNPWCTMYANFAQKIWVFKWYIRKWNYGSIIYIFAWIINSGPPRRKIYIIYDSFFDALEIIHLDHLILCGVNIFNFLCIYIWDFSLYIEIPLLLYKTIYKDL
jgi:hypothetical protein